MELSCIINGCDPFGRLKMWHFFSLDGYWMAYPVLGLLASALLLVAWRRQRRTFKLRLATEE